jgi:hypothetical protein
VYIKNEGEAPLKQKEELDTMTDKIKSLQESVAKAKANVKKIEGTIGKHLASAEKQKQALAKQGVDITKLDELKWKGGKAGTGGSDLYWDICKIEGKEDDAKGAERRLRDATLVLAGWELKLEKEIQKERFLNDDVPQVIKEFMEKWKTRVYDFCVKSFPKYVSSKKKYEDGKAKAREAFEKEYPKLRTWGKPYDEYIAKYLKERDIKPEHLHHSPMVQQMATFRDEAKRLAWLDSELEKEKKFKMLDLVERVTAVTGEITDASGLRIAPKGNLDGFVIGKKGKAKVETIGAGGHHIQRFHFRVLVHEIKEKALPKKA